MKIFLNSNNKLDFTCFDQHTTVQDFINAVDNFLIQKPLACSDCKHNCCRKPWDIRMDNISARKLCKGNLKRFVTQKLIMGVTKKSRIFIGVKLKSSKHCKFLSGLSECLIYTNRPITCRTYICLEESPKYFLLRSAVNSACDNSLVAEFLEENNFDIPHGLADCPSYHKTEYGEVKLIDCIQELGYMSLSKEENEIYKRFLEFEF